MSTSRRCYKHYYRRQSADLEQFNSRADFFKTKTAGSRTGGHCQKQIEIRQLRFYRLYDETGKKAIEDTHT